MCIKESYLKDIRQFENEHGKVKFTKKFLKKLGIKGEPKFDNKIRESDK